MIEIKGKYTTACVMTDYADENLQKQIYDTVNHPAFTNAIKIMPDCHIGKGAVIGFTMPLGDKVIPNVIGVDINCSVLSFMIENISSDGEILYDVSEAIDRVIRNSIPFGTNVHTKYKYNMDRFPWKAATTQARMFTLAFNDKYNSNFKPPIYDMNWFRKKCEMIGSDIKRVIRSLGTLGGGNHFIEIGASEKTGDHWVSIHSGSRKFGLDTAVFWQRFAVKNYTERKQGSMGEAVEKIKKIYPKEEWNKRLLDAKKQHTFVSKGLEYLEGRDMFDYLIDMVFAQAYAHENRQVMKKLILEILGQKAGDTVIESSHNYINFNDFIIRKGAVSAHKDEMMVIPFNMEDGLLICKGKGNPDWNYSAPHGAGRPFSRTDAKKKAKKEGTVQKAKERMEAKGIFVSKLPADELKESYKDAKVIEDAIELTAEIIDRIKPILSMKD